jgi:hypothetical protein
MSDAHQLTREVRLKPRRPFLFKLACKSCAVWTFVQPMKERRLLLCGLGCLASVTSSSLESAHDVAQGSQSSVTSDVERPGMDILADGYPSPYSSLVKRASEPSPTVMFPQWMVEVYQECSSFWAAARRLFLPENSIKSKLPYYKCALPCFH